VKFVLTSLENSPDITSFHCAGSTRCDKKLDVYKGILAEETLYVKGKSIPSMGASDFIFLRSGAF